MDLKTSSFSVSVVEGVKEYIFYSLGDLEEGILAEDSEVVFGRNGILAWSKHNVNLRLLGTPEELVESYRYKDSGLEVVQRRSDDFGRDVLFMQDRSNSTLETEVYLPNLIIKLSNLPKYQHLKGLDYSIGFDGSQDGDRELYRLLFEIGIDLKPVIYVPADCNRCLLDRFHESDLNVADQVQKRGFGFFRFAFDLL